MIERIINMDDGKMVAAFFNKLRELKGVHRFEVRSHRPRRSDRQNRYYWPCFVHEFGEFLRNQGEELTDDHAHELLKHRFLQRSVTDRKTGELLEYSESTTKLDTKEFNAYLDRCAFWLVDMFDIIVPDPADYYEKDDPCPAKPTTTS